MSSTITQAYLTVKRALRPDHVGSGSSNLILAHPHESMLLAEFLSPPHIIVVIEFNFRSFNIIHDIDTSKESNLVHATMFLCYKTVLIIGRRLLIMHGHDDGLDETLFYVPN